jgi:molybdate transport system permease protein
MLNESDLTALAITLKLAGLSTLILLLLGTPLASVPMVRWAV